MLVESLHLLGAASCDELGDLVGPRRILDALLDRACRAHDFDSRDPAVLLLVDEQPERDDAFRLSARRARTCMCSSLGKNDTSRLIVEATSAVWIVEKTRWPVSAAFSDVSTVSRSRISPTMMTSGSWAGARAGRREGFGVGADRAA